MEQLQGLYESTEGMSFTGEVVDKQQIVVKEWTVIEITDGGAALRGILADIYEAVGEGQVWRGFTGPPDYTNYRLWVDLDANVGDTGHYTVIGYEGPFRLEGGAYSGQQGYCFQVE